MLNAFICGTCGFQHQQEDDEPSNCPVSTPRKSKRSSNLCKSYNRDGKNPYSTGGLDKFSVLLAELEEKKQKIYSQMGSQDNPFVRFAYRNYDDCVPIVVRLKGKREEEKKVGETKAKSPRLVAATKQESEILDKFPIESKAAGENRVKAVENIKKERSFSWNTKLRIWRRPSHYFPVVIVLILLLLVFFGRSATTLCTCIVWYMVHTLKGDGSNVRKVTKKNDYVKKLSENKLVRDGLSPPSNNKAGNIKDKSPKRSSHRKR